jgi:PAS domain S-box-containing protein
MFLLFGTFIVACGATHAIEVWNIWHADYWLAGVLKAITALVSVATAISLTVLMPKAVELPNLAQWTRLTANLQKEIRDRKEMEVNLRVSEGIYRDQAELIELTHDAIFVRDLRGEILFWNRAAERLYGWTKDEAKGHIKHELLQTQFPKPLPEIEAEIFAEGSWEGELAHHRRDGSAIVVSSRWALRRDCDGKPISILEANRDITQRRKQDERFRNLLEAAPDAIVIVDQGGRIQLVNAQTERLFDYAREELIGEPVEILIPQRFHKQHLGDRREYSQAPHARAMGAGLELYGRRKNGTEFPVEISLSPLQTEGGTLISSAIRDVTDRRSNQYQIQRLNDNLNQKVTELSAANKDLESFSYSVSHDLRAPLRHIDGFARILKEEHAGSLSEEGQRYLDRVMSAANHMGRLVDDLLNLARVGRREMVVQTTKLDEVVRQVVAELPDEPEGRKVEWLLEPLPKAECDPGLLKLVFFNLLSNAMKFTRGRQPAVIEVNTVVANGAPVIFVRDNGVGFDPKYADKLFGVFQRLHKQEDFEGTGIGLATVQRIIHRHNGLIWAESEPGVGTTFFFTLGQYCKPPEQKIQGELKIG